MRKWERVRGRDKEKNCLIISLSDDKQNWFRPGSRFVF